MQTSEHTGGRELSNGRSMLGRGRIPPPIPLSLIPFQSNNGAVNIKAWISSLRKDHQGHVVRKTKLSLLELTQIL